MGWQDIAAFGIVAATASIFVWKTMQPRRALAGGRRAGPCGCSSPTTLPKQSIVFRARKGERPQIVVRNT